MAKEQEIRALFAELLVAYQRAARDLALEYSQDPRTADIEVAEYQARLEAIFAPGA